MFNSCKHALTDSIPGESATAAAAAAALIESEGGEGAAAMKMKIKPQIATTMCKQPLSPGPQVDDVMVSQMKV